MKELIVGFQVSVLWLCVAVLIALAAVTVTVSIGRVALAARRRLRGPEVVAMAAMSVYCTLFARKGRVSVSDPYIVDNGSYLTNDIAHVSIAKRTPLLPDDTKILVYARQVDSVDPSDWVRLSPHLTFADHPCDYALVNATNYDVIVAADFTPAPTVHTNGVWQMEGFIIPGTGKSAFPNTKIIRKEAP